MQQVDGLVEHGQGRFVLRTGRLVFMTGAGISRESGIATCRDEDGTWRKVPVNEVAIRPCLRDHARVSPCLSQ